MKRKTGFLLLGTGVVMIGAVGCSMASLEEKGSAWWCKDANYSLGEYYEKGKLETNPFGGNTAPDPEKSFRFYEKSIAERSPLWYQSFSKAGIFYLTGEHGIPRDEQKFFSALDDFKKLKDDSKKYESLSELLIAFENAEDKISLPNRARFLKMMEKEYSSCRVIRWYNNALCKPDPENSRRYYQNELVSLRQDEMEEVAKQFINAKDGAELRALCKKHNVPEEIATYIELSKNGFYYGKGTEFDNYTIGESLYALNFQAEMRFSENLPNLPGRRAKKSADQKKAEASAAERNNPKLAEKLYTFFQYRAAYPEIECKKFFSKGCWADLGKIGKKGIAGVKRFQHEFISNGYEDFGSYFAYDTAVDNEGMLGSAASGDVMALLGGQQVKKKRSSQVYFPILEGFKPDDFVPARLQFPKEFHSQMPASFREKEKALEKKIFMRLSDDRLPDAKLGIIRAVREGSPEEIVKDLKQFKFTKKSEKKTMWLVGTFYKVTWNDTAYVAKTAGTTITVRSLSNDAKTKPTISRIEPGDPLYQMVEKGLKEVVPDTPYYLGFKEDGSCCLDPDSKACRLYRGHHEKHVIDAKKDLRRRIALYQKYVVRQIPVRKAEKAFFETGRIPSTLGLSSDLEEANTEFLTSAGQINIAGVVEDKIPLIEVDPKNEADTVKAIAGIKTNLAMSAVFMQAVLPYMIADGTAGENFSQIVLEDNSVVRKAMEDYAKIKPVLRKKKVKTIQGLGMSLNMFGL